ncbi:linker for activation of T-cells family member 1 isoform X4 [Paroedura picta]|uniref:linker for activation of T-cells family member 1 isoform X4 n=1 Tax=Paroedura picta TaxID=143630 RepID=UPI00405682CF
MFYLIFTRMGFLFLHVNCHEPVFREWRYIITIINSFIHSLIRVRNELIVVPAGPTLLASSRISGCCGRIPSPWAPAQRQPILPRTTATRYPLGPPYARTASSGCPQQDPPRPPAPFDTDNEDNESIPSYVNEEQHCATDEDENYFPGYIEVLPDAPVGDKENENGASTGSLGDQYENMPESTASSQHSLGEYVNVLEPDPIIVDLCAEAGSSDLESEEDTPDYENIIRPRD